MSISMFVEAVVDKVAVQVKCALDPRKNCETATKKTKAQLRRERDLGLDMASSYFWSKKMCEGNNWKKEYCRSNHYLNGEIKAFRKQAERFYFDRFGKSYGKLKKEAVALFVRAGDISRFCDPFDEKLDVKGPEFKAKETAARRLRGAVSVLLHGPIECSGGKRKRHVYGEVFPDDHGKISEYSYSSYVQTVKCYLKHEDAPGGREFVGAFICYGWGPKNGKKCVESYLEY